METLETAILSIAHPPRVEADRIIRLQQTNAPIRINEIAKAFGLSLKIQGLPEGISGKIVKEAASPSGYAIYVAQGEPLQRQRFTAAHEIAHYVLHLELIGDGITDTTLYRSALPSRIEAEANEFAADILMPWGLINDAVQQGITDVDKLADKFNVSKIAMSVRLGLAT